MDDWRQGGRGALSGPLLWSNLRRNYGQKASLLQPSIFSLTGELAQTESSRDASEVQLTETGLRGNDGLVGTRCSY